MRREDDKEIAVLEMYSRENPPSQVGTENPIHIVPLVGFEPGSQWKASQDITTPT